MVDPNPPSPEPEREPGVNKMAVSNSCLLAAATIVFGVMLVVTYKVFKIVRFGDPKMLLMLIFLDITLAGKINEPGHLSYSEYCFLCYSPLASFRRKFC